MSKETQERNAAQQKCQSKEFSILIDLARLIILLVYWLGLKNNFERCFGVMQTVWTFIGSSASCA